MFSVETKWKETEDRASVDYLQTRLAFVAESGEPYLNVEGIAESKLIKTGQKSRRCIISRPISRTLTPSRRGDVLQSTYLKHN